MQRWPGDVSSGLGDIRGSVRRYTWNSRSAQLVDNSLFVSERYTERARMIAEKAGLPRVPKPRACVTRASLRRHRPFIVEAVALAVRSLKIWNRWLPGRAGIQLSQRHHEGVRSHQTGPGGLWRCTDDASRVRFSKVFTCTR